MAARLSARTVNRTMDLVTKTSRSRTKHAATQRLCRSIRLQKGLFRRRNVRPLSGRVMRRGRLPRNHDLKNRPAIVACSDGPAVPLDDRFDDRKAQSAASCRLSGCVSLIEALEDQREMLGG